MKDLNSIQNPEMLLALITKCKPTWSSHGFSACKDAKRLIQMLHASINQDKRLECVDGGLTLMLRPEKVSEASVDSGGRTFQGVSSKASEHLLASLNGATFT